MPGSEQIHMRVTPSELAILKEAARVCKMSLTTFMMTAALADAREEPAQKLDFDHIP